VRRDDGARPAGREPGRVLLVQVGHLLRERRGTGRVVVGVVGVDGGQLRRHLLGDRGQQGGVEPEVRVEGAVPVPVLLGVLLPVVVMGRLVQRRRLRGVHDVRRRVRVDRVVHGRLEVGQVHHQVGAAHLVHLRGGELEVVRLGPGRGQRPDVDQVAADLLRHVLQRVERGQHAHAAAAAAVAGPPGAAGPVGGAGGQGERGDEDRGDGGEREGATAGGHESHSRPVENESQNRGSGGGPEPRDAR
jgi:hypothetical protein